MAESWDLRGARGLWGSWPMGESHGGCGEGVLVLLKGSWCVWRAAQFVPAPGGRGGSLFSAGHSPNITPVAVLFWKLHRIQSFSEQV